MQKGRGGDAEGYRGTSLWGQVDPSISSGILRKESEWCLSSQALPGRLYSRYLALGSNPTFALSLLSGQMSNGERSCDLLGRDMEGKCY